MLDRVFDLIPPRPKFAVQKSGDEKNRRRNFGFLENGTGVEQDVPVTVIDGDRQSPVRDSRSGAETLADVGQRQHLEVPLQENTLPSQRFWPARMETVGKAMVRKDSEAPAGAPQNRL